MYPIPYHPIFALTPEPNAEVNYLIKFQFQPNLPQIKTPSGEGN